MNKKNSDRRKRLFLRNTIFVVLFLVCTSLLASAQEYIGCEKNEEACAQGYHETLYTRKILSDDSGEIRISSELIRLITNNMDIVGSSVAAIKGMLTIEGFSFVGNDLLASKINMPNSPIYGNNFFLNEIKNTGVIWVLGDADINSDLSSSIMYAGSVEIGGKTKALRVESKVVKPEEICMDDLCISEWKDLEQYVSVCGDGNITYGEECEPPDESECTPEYDEYCLYCNDQCQSEMVQGPRCGDGICQEEYEDEYCGDCGPPGLPKDYIVVD